MRRQSIVLGLLIVAALALIAHIAAHSDTFQWDFRAYYTAAEVQSLGMSPYDNAAMQMHSPVGASLRYIYAPLTVWLFRPFVAMPYATAAIIWLAIKLALAVGLLAVWRRHFLPGRITGPVALLLLFGFGATLYVDFVTGNISIIEQFLLWLGLAFLINDRMVGFVAAVVAASLFKLSPILFLFAALAIRRKPAWLPVVWGGVAFAVWLALNYWSDPLEFGQFMSAVWATHEGGALGNPSQWAFWHDLFNTMGTQLGLTLPELLPAMIYAALAILVCVGSFRFWQAHRMSDDGTWKRESLFVFCAAFALVMPRFKTYSFILLLPAAAFVLQRSRHWTASGFLLTLLVLAAVPPRPFPLPIDPYLTLLWLYYPLLLTAMIWTLLVVGGPSGHRPPIAEPEVSI